MLKLNLRFTALSISRTSLVIQIFGADCFCSKKALSHALSLLFLISQLVFKRRSASSMTIRQLSLFSVIFWQANSLERLSCSLSSTSLFTLYTSSFSSFAKAPTILDLPVPGSPYKRILTGQISLAPSSFLKRVSLFLSFSFSSDFSSVSEPLYLKA